MAAFTFIHAACLDGWSGSKEQLIPLEVAARQLRMPTYFLNKLLGSIFVFAGNSGSPGKRVRSCCVSMCVSVCLCVFVCLRVCVSVCVCAAWAAVLAWSCKACKPLPRMTLFCVVSRCPFLSVQYDLGLRMKFSNKGLEAVGYTRRINDVITH